MRAGDVVKLQAAEADQQHFDAALAQRAHDFAHIGAHALLRHVHAQIVDAEFDDGDVGVGADGLVEAVQRAPRGVAGTPAFATVTS